MGGEKGGGCLLNCNEISTVVVVAAAAVVATALGDLPFWALECRVSAAAVAVIVVTADADAAA